MWPRRWKPIIIKNSRIPGVVSKITSISISVVCFAIFVFCKYKNPSKTQVRHETIHFQQQLELLFVFQWILYGFFWLKEYIKSKDAFRAYYLNPFEQEAYQNEDDANYLKERKRFSWWRYRKNGIPI